MKAPKLNAQKITIGITTKNKSSTSKVRPQITSTFAQEGFNN